MTLPHLIRIALVVFGFGLASAMAKTLEISPGLTIDTSGEDATYQKVPAFDEEMHLCLWKGDDLLAVIFTVHEKYRGDWHSFLRQTERGMREEGGTNIKMTAGPIIRSKAGAEIRRYDTSFKAEGEDNRVIYYIVKSDTGYHSIIVTLTEPTAYESIRTRMDKLLATVALAPK